MIRQHQEAMIMIFMMHWKILQVVIPWKLIIHCLIKIHLLLITIIALMEVHRLQLRILVIGHPIFTTNYNKHIILFLINHICKNVRIKQIIISFQMNRI